MEGEPGATLFENTHAVSIMLVLREEGPMVKGDLAHSMSKGTSTVQRRVEDLVEAGLVEERRETVRPFKRIVSLTAEGEAAADLLKQLDDLVRGVGTKA